MDFRIAIASLNQWALDFEGNTRRIIESIKEASSKGAIYRTGGELELCGYSLEDAFFESDTVYHCWQSLARILDSTKDSGIISDIGMPIHFGSLYNCRVICRMGRILCIRAKTSLAKEGNYREYRHFSAWPLSAGIVPFRLPPQMVSEGHSEYVPFGADFVLDLIGPREGTTLRLGWEICQELWDIKNVSSDLYDKYGCHLVVNSSGSYWELRKLKTVNEMVKGVSLRSGACYAYANLFGCDGQRYVFSGVSSFYDRGELKEMMQISSMLIGSEKQLIYYDVSPGEIDKYRAQRGIRPNLALTVEPKIWDLSSGSTDASQVGSSHKILQLRIDRPARKAFERTHSYERMHQLSRINFVDEINIYVPLWLWDYLRRSGMRGFMVPLSGGLDSSTVAMLVYEMCRQLYLSHLRGESEAITLRDYLARCFKLTPAELEDTLASPENICRRLLKCAYISTKFSSPETESRARTLSETMGARFSVISIQNLYEQARQMDGTNRPPSEVTLLDQNLQARLRMTMTYHLSEGNRIVLATGNVDEGIMGYLTKYDCSSADINPIGGLCKEDLKSYLSHCCNSYDGVFAAVLSDIIKAPPSAELTGSEQRDEDEIGLTYEEISVLGKVRRGVYGCCGPRGAFECVWRNRRETPFKTSLRCFRDNELNPAAAAIELGKLIKRFYQRYMRNRHKLTVLTPALHAETYSPDDNRFDHRQFLYPGMEQQFACIDQMVADIVEERRDSSTLLD